MKPELLLGAAAAGLMGWRWWVTRPKAEAPEDSREKPEESHAPTTSAPRQSHASRVDFSKIPPRPTKRCPVCGFLYLTEEFVLGRGFDPICNRCYVKEQAKLKAEREAKEREDDFLKHEAEW